MLVHLRPIVVLRLHSLQCSGPNIDRLDGCIARGPINVRSSIFNEILPIRDFWDWASDGQLNNGHWLIRTQAWAISANVVISQWSFA